MSMCLGLVTLSDASIVRVLRDPPLVWQVVAPDDPQPAAAAAVPAKRPTWWSRLFGRERPPARIPDLELSSVEGAAMDLDKAWHGIHYLLTGTAWEGDYPRNFLVSGGAAVGDIDVGYGPARVLTAAATRAARDALRELSDADLAARFDPQDMLARLIYPEIWVRTPDQDDPLGYLMEHVRALRGFLDRAVEQGLGILVYLS